MHCDVAAKRARGQDVREALGAPTLLLASGHEILEAELFPRVVVEERLPLGPLIELLDEPKAARGHDWRMGGARMRTEVRRFRGLVFWFGLCLDLFGGETTAALGGGAGASEMWSAVVACGRPRCERLETKLAQISTHRWYSVANCACA